MGGDQDLTAAIYYPSSQAEYTPPIIYSDDARGRERGTMETLLATPAKPFEVMIGKIVPYILVGYVQVGLIMLVATLIFHVPFQGSILLLIIAAFFFIAANLSMGILFSTIARKPTSGHPDGHLLSLPLLLLSGFMFPFRSMPEWAQWIGSFLALTYFLRIVRGIMLKGNSIPENRLAPLAHSPLQHRRHNRRLPDVSQDLGLTTRPTM